MCPLYIESRTSGSLSRAGRRPPTPDQFKKGESLVSDYTINLYGGKGFDLLAPPTSFTEFVNAGYEFYIGYTQQMTATDLNNALNSGLAVALAFGYWPQEIGDDPTTWANTAVADAEAIGYIKGANLWLDMEHWQNYNQTDVINWVNTFVGVVAAAGYVPGVYVGANTANPPLTSAQLYNDLNVSHYWKSCSSVPTPETRGYQMIQTCGTVVGSYTVDDDYPQHDNLGGSPIFMGRTPA